jgi:hypothetical protein
MSVGFGRIVLLTELEKKMETVIPNEYNPNALITYKKIAGTYAMPEAPEFITDKVVDLEWQLHRGRESQVELNKLNSLINNLDEQIVEWYDPNYSKEEVLQGLCDYFGINPTKEIEITGKIDYTVIAHVPLNEVEDFDAEAFIIDNLSIDMNYGDGEVSDWSIYSAEDNR